MANRRRSPTISTSVNWRVHESLLLPYDGILWPTPNGIWGIRNPEVEYTSLSPVQIRCMVGILWSQRGDFTFPAQSQPWSQKVSTGWRSDDPPKRDPWSKRPDSVFRALEGQPARWLIDGTIQELGLGVWRQPPYEHAWRH